jgi:hypothetical protein
MGGKMKYIPVEVNCVWVRDIVDGQLTLIGQVPRGELTEEDVELPPWVNDKYDVCFGTVEDFMVKWIRFKQKTASFNLAGMEIY